MSTRYEIEFEDPVTFHCDCCGGLTVRLTRFLHGVGVAFAVYSASYSYTHEGNELAMLISLGEWGEDSSPEQRAAFYCRVRPTDDSYEVMLDDVAHSPWSSAKIIGAKLTREQARAHEWKASAFEVLDEAFLVDRSLRGFLDRVHCGDAAVPLEFGYGAPDEIFALTADQKSRATIHRSFATLDGNRFFIRGLLPIPVEGYDRWCIGLWVEISHADFDACRAAWDDPERYTRLQFIGRIANDVESDAALAVRRETEVTLHVPDAKVRPHIRSTPGAELAALISRVWPKAEFEAYAVQRGLL